MLRRLFDVTMVGTALVLLSPVLAIAAIGIRLSSPGPVLYRARRVGRKGRPFTMYKFRTMSVRQDSYRSSITARDDPRVFPFGALLRRLKIDELPQLFNILKGEMAIVGPRPEDPQIMSRYYAPEHLETLNLPPGLSSPGSIYYYTQCEDSLGVGDTEEDYGKRILPVKLALDIVYIREASLAYDVKLVLRTGWVILARGLGKRRFDQPAELRRAAALGLLPASSCS
jgi:lipopolysaccharide/colanic/teichoic acid biosynthesis glycosyltransferase